MPTGYTASVADGSVTDLRTFALQCARGMGALVMMRDDPWDKPIPERFEPSDYHVKALADVQASLEALRAMSPADWQPAADAQLAERVAAAASWLADKREQRVRYDAMIAQVEAWQDAPEGIKTFMLDQLSSGRDFDCREGEYWQSLDPQTGEEWKAEREEKLTSESAYHAKERQKEVDRTEGRNAWIAQLRRSLPSEQVSG